MPTDDDQQKMGDEFAARLREEREKRVAEGSALLPNVWSAAADKIIAATMHSPGLVAMWSHFDMSRGRLVFEFSLTELARTQCYRRVLLPGVPPPAGEVAIADGGSNR